jgi:4-carboxymuconolactone decarboxylase
MVVGTGRYWWTVVDRFDRFDQFDQFDQMTSSTSSTSSSNTTQHDQHGSHKHMLQSHSHPYPEPVMPRLAPITGKSDVPAEHHAVVDDIIKVFKRVRGPYSVLLHSPKIAKQLLDVGGFFRDQSIVDARLRTIAILVTARERQSAYVWAAQFEAAHRAGIPEETLALIRSKADPGKFCELEREVVDYTEQLMRTNRASQAAFDALHRRHGAQWLVELTAAINYYGALSGIVNAFEVGAPEDGDAVPR